MKQIRTFYTYLFYFFYNSVNKVKGNILVQWKAVAMVLILEAGLISSLVTYYLDIFKVVVPRQTNKLQLLIIVTPLVLLKLYVFERNENWRKYLNEFDAWPEDKRKKYDRMAKAVIVFIAANFILSLYIMSQIDWKQYR